MFTKWRAFGFGMLWLALFQYPMLAVFQEMVSRIGLVTGGGLAAAIKNKYPKEEKQVVVILFASLILIANTINLGADIGAMAASVKLIFPHHHLQVQQQEHHHLQLQQQEHHHR
ncbi:MAG: divalent metal cation transporter [Candidatus Nitrosopolaris sp.]